MPALPPPKTGDEEDFVDVIVVGGGPAGLSAALILGRSRRSVIIFDSGEKRNEASQIQHGILGADGFNREEFLSQARDQVLKYPTVELKQLAVVDLNIEAARTERCTPGEIEAGTCETKVKTGERITKTWSFEVTAEDGTTWRSKKVVLATGVKDLIPEVLSPFWGRGVWVCLYCDAYEYTDQPQAAYGNGERGIHLAFEMLLWSKQVTLLTDGEALEATAKDYCSGAEEQALLKRHGIKVVTSKVKELYADPDGELGGVVFEDGTRLPVRFLVFNTGRCQNSSLPSKMGLKSDDRGDLICEMKGNVASVHGLYVAGNCATAPLKLVMTAASQGATVGAKINSELMYEELGLVDGLYYQDKEREAIRESSKQNLNEMDGNGEVVAPPSGFNTGANGKEADPSKGDGNGEVLGPPSGINRGGTSKAGIENGTAEADATAVAEE
ncbi:hypothetical protein N2152v2_008273 [Parachlorella kessleri]